MRVLMSLISIFLVPGNSKTCLKKTLFSFHPSGRKLWSREPPQGLFSCCPALVWFIFPLVFLLPLLGNSVLQSHLSALLVSLSAGR